MDILEQVLRSILSEYGIFVLFLVISHGVLLYTIRTLWEQNLHLSGKLLDTVETNTKVLTQIINKLENHKE